MQKTMRTVEIITLAGQSGSGKSTVGDYIATKYGATSIAFADPLKRFLGRVFGFTEAQLWGPPEARMVNDPRFDNASITSNTLIHEIDEKFLVSAPDWLNEIFWDYSPQTRALASISLESWFSSTIIKLMDEGLNVRYALQTLGTWGRKVDPDIWAKYGVETTSYLLGGPNDYDRTKGLVFAAKPAPLVVITDCRYKNELAKVRANGGVAIRILRPSTDRIQDIGGISGHQSESELAEIPLDDFDAIITNDGTVEDLQREVDAALSRFAI